MKRSFLFVCIALLATNTLIAQVKKTAPRIAPKPAFVSTEKLVEISTPFGVMVAKLYDSTPLHRDNFVKLVQQKFYDSLLFHRVIKDFMIQGGDPTSKRADSSAMLGSGSAPGERIPAEFKPTCFHKKGALAAARDNNPQKASSNCQFYIVQGRLTDSTQLPKNVSYTAQQKEIYRRIGGTAFLDQNYTVFGEVISGLEVLDKIATTPTRPGDRPITDVPMRIRLLP